jgi:hypothetical protein
MARAAAIAAMAVALGTTVTATPAARPRTEASAAAVLTPYRATVVVNGARSGPVFQGIGAISGGGGNSRLLINYPPRERARILDYLFSPHFGASLQLLKLEIGGGGLYRYGPAGLGSLGYYPVRYPSFTIGSRPADPGSHRAGPHRLAGWRRSPQNG